MGIPVGPSARRPSQAHHMIRLGVFSTLWLAAFYLTCIDPFMCERMFCIAEVLEHPRVLLTRYHLADYLPHG